MEVENILPQLVSAHLSVFSNDPRILTSIISSVKEISSIPRLVLGKGLRKDRSARPETLTAMGPECLLTGKPTGPEMVVTGHSLCGPLPTQKGNRSKERK